MKINKTIISTAVIALVIGLGAGYGIHGLISPSRAGNFPSGANGMGNFSGSPTGTTKGMNRSSMSGLLTGTVASKDSGSITIDTKDGSSRIILVTPNTSVSKSVNGSQTDVSIGATVMISGTTNGDGSVSASVIQLRPATPPATIQ